MMSSPFWSDWYANVRRPSVTAGLLEPLLWVLPNRLELVYLEQ